jgi:hypothetical protein
MRGPLAKAIQFIRAHVTWHFIGIVLSGGIIAVAAYTLFHLLRDVEVAKVTAALRDTRSRSRRCLSPWPTSH